MSRRWRVLVDEFKKNGWRAIAAVFDVAKKAEVENMVTETVAAFGRIDILVNNAGMDMLAHCANSVKPIGISPST